MKKQHTVIAVVGKAAARKIKVGLLVPIGQHLWEVAKWCKGQWELKRRRSRRQYFTLKLNPEAIINAIQEAAKKAAARIGKSVRNNQFRKAASNQVLRPSTHRKPMLLKTGFSAIPA